MMLSTLTLAVFVTSAAAVDRSEFTVNELLKRQEGRSGAQYQCHADCGYTILDASADNCNNSTWTDLLSNCEECANTYNILRHYGDQVKSAAEDCGLDVTFSPSAGASSTSAPAQTSSEAALSSNAATTSAPSSGDAASATTTSYGTSASGAITPSSTSNTSTLATSPATPSETAVEESTGAGAKLGSPYGAAILAVLTLTGVFLQTLQ